MSDAGIVLVCVLSVCVWEMAAVSICPMRTRLSYSMACFSTNLLDSRQTGRLPFCPRAKKQTKGGK